MKSTKIKFSPVTMSRIESLTLIVVKDVIELSENR